VKQFQADFDFERANEQFQEQLGDMTADLSKVSIEGDGKEGQPPADEFSASGRSTPTNGESAPVGPFYDKNSSFFDSISCEALEREEGRNNRPDWKKERVTNTETFGALVRSLAYRRGGRGGRYPQQNRYSGGNGGYRGGYNQQRGGHGGYGGYGRQRYGQPQQSQQES